MTSQKTKLPPALTSRLQEFHQGTGTLVLLTGAGISAESGIPTFRGQEGYWTIGSAEYHPREMATMAMFRREPLEVWSWYLYRRSVCRQAQPNPGHAAAVRLGQSLGSRFQLITQNVDGLHLRAGHPQETTWQIHGNVDFRRCAAACGTGILPVPEGLHPWVKGRCLSQEEARILLCSCGALTRPHVLWFDEFYDEENFRFDSSIRAASNAALLIVVGTSGATNLPIQVGQAALGNGATIIDINPDPNPFSAMAEQAETGFFLQGEAGRWLPALASVLA